MKSLRVAFVAVAALVIALSAGQRGKTAFLQTQRDQIAVFILVNVTPAPVGYKPVPAGPMRIATNVSEIARGSSRFVDAPNIDLGSAVAQSQAQSAVRVQASVSPNPNATMLYSNVPTVTINQTAGTTATTPTCVYTVTVHTATSTSWTLDDGLSGDFITTNWTGGSLANNTYIQGATPQPTSTPFVVFTTDGSHWNQKANGSGMKTYCVTLTLSIPASVPGGAYSTNAIYTLYF
jgi:hypothetical protein